MKIARLDIFRCDLPVKGKPYTMSSGALTSMDSTIVRLTTDSGHVGWGETCPLGATYAPAHAEGARAALNQMAPDLIGTPMLPGVLHARMNACLAGHAYAKAANDIALYDALGRAHGVPVSTLLGGAHVDQVRACTAIGLYDPDETARLAADSLSQGYRRLQIKVGGRSLDEDIAVIRKVSEVALPIGAQLVADANRGWRVRDEILFSHACRDVPVIIEQPCDTLTEHRQLRPHLCHPLYLDESTTDLATFFQILGDRLADGFGAKLTRLGGLHPFTSFRDACAALRLPHTCDDAWGGDIIAAACVHAAASVAPDQLDGVWLAEPHIDGHYDTENGLRAENGDIKLPQSPGLGVRPDISRLTAVASYA